MKKPISGILSVAALALAFVACDQGSSKTENTQATHNSEIDWFDGTADEAFEYAKETGKPIFLYWGAAWCPPCHAINATVFRSAEFIARSALFVSVYLDGDTENAQAVGERFGVRGYPTMIVFDAGGNELTRIPGGIDIQAYMNILDLTLGDLLPADQLVASVLAGGKTLTDSECRLLAYYSWDQNPGLMEDLDAVLLYRGVYDACPERLQPERSIVYMSYLNVLTADTDTESGGLGLNEQQLAEALEKVNAILEDPELLQANTLAVIFDADNITRALTETGTASRATLLARFNLAISQLADDENVYVRERVYALLGKLELEQIDDDEAELSAGLQEDIRSMVAWADSSTTDPYERHVVINAVANVLQGAGMFDIARSILATELGKSLQPYYFMIALAEIEQDSGNYDEALQWLKQAYDESRGPATRFQWGYYYIAGLLEMAPHNSELIREVTVSAIRELEAGSGFYQRPKVQLERLEQRLVEWSEKTEQGEVIDAIRTDVLAVCDHFANQQGSFETCQAFLDRA